MKAKWRSIVSGLEAALLLLALGLSAAPPAYAQADETGTCEVQYSFENKDRYVYGPIDNECSSGGVHSAPFGNWGVQTESSDKKDGRQFEGWCRNRILCDNNNRCKRYCTDSWYEWNSCTFHEWSPPNRDFYNHNNNTQQKTTRRNNHHGDGSVYIDVPCPSDSDGDGYKESGGCQALFANGFSVSGHRMQLYELDGKGIGRAFSTDTHVETLRFPNLTISAAQAGCNDADYCSGSRLGTWHGPYSSSSRKTSAKAAIRIVRARFRDDLSQDCCDPVVDSECAAQ